MYCPNCGTNTGDYDIPNSEDFTCDECSWSGFVTSRTSRLVTQYRNILAIRLHHARCRGPRYEWEQLDADRRRFEQQHPELVTMRGSIEDAILAEYN